MKRKLIFASNNQNKADEIRYILGDSFQLMTLQEAGVVADIPEPHDSFQENALEKSRYIYNETGMDCFSEDSGLEVAALNGAPGVKSARYAGEKSTDKQNTEKLLAALENVPHRAAQFKTVISLILDGKEYFFEGECKGDISKIPMGNNGFGYDPVFVPAGSTKSFAEMTMDEKSAISHRKKAVKKMAEFLLNL